MNFKQYESIAPEPFGLTDAGLIAIATLEKGISGKSIYNVDFVEAKEALRRLFDKLFSITSLINRPEYADQAFYNYIYTASIDGVSGELHNINSFVKSVTKFLQYESPDDVPNQTDYRLSFQMIGTSDDFDTFKAKTMARRSERIAEMAKTWDRDRKLAARLISEVETWRPVAELVKQAKLFIVKGKKPSTGHSDAFRPSLVKGDTSEMVGTVLRRVIDEQRNILVDRLTKHYTELAQGIVDELNGHDFDSVDKRRDDIMRKARGMGVDFLISKNEDGVYQVREHDVIVRNVNGIVNVMVQRYVFKNIRKIAPIVDKKGAPANIDAHGSLEGWGFHGSLVFKFDDGTEFTVRNKVVTLWNTRNAVEQFPTTFHNVTFPNGKVEKFVSEKDMNERWVK